MNCSISRLFTALLFSAAIVPNSLSQLTHSSEQPISDLAKPVSTRTEVLPESSQSPVLEVSMTSYGRSRRMSYSHPAYCSLPPKAKPGDWDYREAMYKCLHGGD